MESNELKPEGKGRPEGSEYLENSTNDAGERLSRFYHYGACIHARAAGPMSD